MALYRCIANGGGASATDITPSNASPATLSADGVYHATAAGKAIASYTDVVPSDIVPTAMSNGNIYRMDGASGYAVEHAPTLIAPSDAVPAALTNENVYLMDGSGYAIESYTDINPQSGATALAGGNMYCTLQGGYAIPGYVSITPSNANPPYLAAQNFHYVPSGSSGYAIESYGSVTPSNSSPAVLSSGAIDKMAGNGYAIESYQSKTPTSSGTSFSAGFVQMSSAGVAYTRSPMISGYTNPMSSITASGTTFSFNNMLGSILLVFLFYQSGSSTAYNRLDGATCVGGNWEKLCNLRNTNGQAYGTFYVLGVSSDTCTVTAPYSCYMQVFEAKWEI